MCGGSQLKERVIVVHETMIGGPHQRCTICGPPNNFTSNDPGRGFND